MSLLVHFRIQKSCFIVYVFFRWSLTLWRARSSCSCAEIATAEKLSYDTTKREGVLTISNFLAIKKMWAQISFALVLFTLVSAKNRTDYLYNGDGKVVLSLEKPFKVEILNKDGEVKATFNLPAAKEAAIKGSKTKNDFALDIDYSGGSIKGDKGSLSDAKFKFDITYNTSTG